MKIKAKIQLASSRDSVEVILSEDALKEIVLGQLNEKDGQIQSVSLCVEHDGCELEAYATEESTGCAGISIDGKAGNNLFYLASVETPGEYCKDSFTARLYGGNCEYETDGPIALVKSKANGKKPDLTPYSINDPLTKIVYIDRDCAVAKVWNDQTENLSEHIED